MPELRIPSDLFVGRKQELNQFRQLFTPNCTINILHIHTNGDGGIGKTRLLVKMQEICKNEFNKQVIFIKNFIDFYHIASRSRIGVLQQIAENLNFKYFPRFKTQLDEYQKTDDISRRQDLTAQLQESFFNEYHLFAQKQKRQGKTIVLFFDTYEFIQEPPSESVAPSITETTLFSQWIEKKFFSHLVENSRLIVSGRYRLREVDRSQLTIHEIELPRFNRVDSAKFWKECFHLNTDSELAEKLGSESIIRTYYNLTDGTPILLALFADWVNYKRNPLSPQGLLDEIEKRVGRPIDPVSTEHKRLFEKALIERIGSMIAPEDRAVTYMAIGSRRMTPEIFHAISGVPLKQAKKILLDILKPLSFVKYKEENVVILHDEMQWLVLEHWWDQGDIRKTLRQKIAQKLVEYYDATYLNQKNLPEEERETYTPELIEYAFLAQPQEGLNRFNNEFDIALEDGRHDYAELLLREAENYLKKNPESIPFPQNLNIIRRRIQHINDAENDPEKALKYLERIFKENADNPIWKDCDERAHFLLARGIAELYSRDNQKARASLEDAKRIFFVSGEDILLYEAKNWLGLALYRQGNFTKALKTWLSSQEGFMSLLYSSKQFNARERRRLFQDLRYTFANLALIHNHRGQFDTAVRYAEIALDLVRYLRRNNKEIARMRILLSEMLAFTGRTIDAQHHATRALRIFNQQQINDPIWLSRLYINRGLLKYRTREFTHILEYYRAEEIAKIIKERRFIQKDNFQDAGKFIVSAIKILRQYPIATPKYLAGAYYALGELYMVSPAQDHWKKAEEAFNESLEWSKESQFLYQELDVLESLVTLYYFWEGDSKESVQSNPDCKKELAKYEHETAELYPDIFGKYYITLGDITFDQALLSLFACDINSETEDALSQMTQAFQYYIKASNFMKKFNNTQYYLTLRIFYNRLNTIVEKTLQRQKNELSFLENILHKLSHVWRGKYEEFDRIYQYVLLRIEPEKHLKEIENLQSELYQSIGKEVLEFWLLLDDCLLGVYKALFFSEKISHTKKDVFREEYIVLCMTQSRVYRSLGDEYQAEQYIKLATQELDFFEDITLRDELFGYINTNVGTLKYRKGEYGKMVEFYLNDQLKIAKRRFDEQDSEGRDIALDILLQSESQLEDSISLLESFMRESDPEEIVLLEKRKHRRKQNLAETQFRIGELLMLNEQYEDTESQKGAFNYLKQAVEALKDDEDNYFYHNTVQSYANALYFHGDSADDKEKRLGWEKWLETRFSSSKERCYPRIMGRMRITQGDALFSELFTQREELTQAGEKRRKYRPREGQLNIRALRTMLQYYVEACNFMAQHSAIDFSIAARVLQQRIEFISDQGALQIINQGLSDVWADQEFLSQEMDVLNTLVLFAKIRSMMLAYENDN